MAAEKERRSGGGGGGGSGGCLSDCFGGGSEATGEGSGELAARVLRASSRWVRERAAALPKLVARVRQRRLRRRQQQLARDFHYDPISYALNFEEDGAGEDGGEAGPLKHQGFSSRLPASLQPPPTLEAAAAAAAATERGGS